MVINVVSVVIIGETLDHGPMNLVEHMDQLE